MSAEKEERLFEEGAALFNAGRFFECHEVWESLWRRSRGEKKRFYQGLIQAAVALLHAERGNLAGAASVYAKARTKLDPLPAIHMGVRIGRLRDELTRFFAVALGEKDQPLPPPPRLRRTRKRKRGAAVSRSLPGPGDCGARPRYCCVAPGSNCASSGSVDSVMSSEINML